jgi:formate dehydrogenase subunit gamma
MHPPAELRRFAPPVRWVHRSMAVLMGVCIVTAAALYLPELSTLVGHRYLVGQLHYWTGLALPVPLLVGLLSPDYRADARRLNRFTSADRQWLRRRTRTTARVGKFNAGQKLNAALSLGAIGVLLGTGFLMHNTHLVRLTLRTGATFVHDWSALALGLLVIGHVVKASRDPLAMKGMRTGKVPRSWAEEHHPEWASEVEEPKQSA